MEVTVSVPIVLVGRTSSMSRRHLYRRGTGAAFCSKGLDIRRELPTDDETHWCERCTQRLVVTLTSYARNRQPPRNIDWYVAAGELVFTQGFGLNFTYSLVVASCRANLDLIRPSRAWILP